MPIGESRRRGFPAGPFVNQWRGFHMRITSLRSAAAVALAAGLVACYPGTVNSTGELDVVITVSDPNTNFAVLQTYSLPDSVVHLTFGGNDDISRAFDDDVLTEVRAQLNATGMVEEPDPDNNPPDVIVLLAITANDNFDAYVSYPWWDYWGWYPYWGCCGPGYGIGYPGYGTVDIVQYRTGTVLIDMIDLARVDDQAQQINSVWIAALNGLAEGAGLGARIMDGIDQAFDQSPYLGG
jgi:hypothetical protein